MAVGPQLPAAFSLVQLQREREAEDDEFAGKEEFVTTAYKKKLEEVRIQEELDRLQTELEGPSEE